MWSLDKLGVISPPEPIFEGFWGNNKEWSLSELGRRGNGGGLGEIVGLFPLIVNGLRMRYSSIRISGNATSLDIPLLFTFSCDLSSSEKQLGE